MPGTTPGMTILAFLSRLFFFFAPFLAAAGAAGVAGGSVSGTLPIVMICI